MRWTTYACEKPSADHKTSNFGVVYCACRQILKKIEEFGNDLIEIQLEKFHRDEETDLEDLTEAHQQQVAINLQEPSELFEALLRNVEGTKAFDPFISLLQRLLYIRDENDSRARTYQLIDEIITQIAMDRRGVGRDFSETFGVSVSAILSKFSSEDQIKEAQAEAKNARDLAKRLLKEKNDLELQLSMGADGLVGRLKEQIKQLEDLLRYSKNTVVGLQRQTKDLRAKFQEKLILQDKQMQELYGALRREAEAGARMTSLRERSQMESKIMRSVIWGNDGDVDDVPKEDIVVTRGYLISEIERLWKEHGLDKPVRIKR